MRMIQIRNGTYAGSVKQFTFKGLVALLQEQKKSRKDAGQDEATTPHTVGSASPGSATAKGPLTLRQSTLKNLNEELEDHEETEEDKQREIKEKAMEQLEQFRESPFKADHLFLVNYMAQITKDCQNDFNSFLIDNIFFDKIFNKLLLDDFKEVDDNQIYHTFQTMLNLMDCSHYRAILADQGYLKKLFAHQQHLISEVSEVANKNEQATKEERYLFQSKRRFIERLCQLAISIVHYQDELEKQILELNIIPFLIQALSPKSSQNVREQGIFGLSIISSNEVLISQLIKYDIVDRILELCLNPEDDLRIKYYSTVTLVHFSLNKRIIQILIQKGIMNLFQSFGKSYESYMENLKDDEKELFMSIQTNISWIFLALCRNGISGKQMLQQGITRNMFLVSCNPNYEQIRHLVITSFAQLGQISEKAENVHAQCQFKEAIQQEALKGIRQKLIESPKRKIQILLKFSASDDLKYQLAAFWALKKYLLFNQYLGYKNLISLQHIVQAFINGSISNDKDIQNECANAIAFMVYQQIMYHPNSKQEEYLNPKLLARAHTIKLAGEVENMAEKMNERLKKIQDKIQRSAVEYGIDAIMNLTGSDQESIRAIAFSALSKLAIHSSNFRTVKAQIQRDINLPENLASNQYRNFIYDRLEEKKSSFNFEFKQHEIETQYSGLFCLLRLGQGSDKSDEYMSAYKYIEFIEQVEQLQNEQDERDQLNIVEQDINMIHENETYFIDVFKALKHSENEATLCLVLKVVNFYNRNHHSQYFQDIISPHTLMWLLQIINQFSSNYYLSCLSSLVLLNIVRQHTIHICCREQMMTQLFFKVLRKVAAIHLDLNFNDEDLEVSSDDSQNSNQFQVYNLKQLIGNTKETATTAQENIMTKEWHRESVEANQKQDTENKTVVQQTKNDFPFNYMNEYKKERAEEDQMMKNILKERQKQKSHKQQLQFTNQILQLIKQSTLIFQQDITQVKKSYEKLRMYYQANGQMNKALKVIFGSIDVHLPSKARKQSSNLNLRQMFVNKKGQNHSQASISSKTPSASDDEESPQPNKSFTFLQHNTSSVAAVPADTSLMNLDSTLSLLWKEGSQASDSTKVKNYLRDSIIQAFMIIFAKEDCHHLLMNNDLIDISFTCLENSIDLTLEAQKQVARITSLLIKFPSVQMKMLNQNHQPTIQLLDHQQDLQQTNCGGKCGTGSDDLQSWEVTKLKNVPKVILGMSNLLNLCSYDLMKENTKPNTTADIQMRNDKLDVIKQVLKCLKILSKNVEFTQNYINSICILESLMNILKSKMIILELDEQDIKNIIQSLRNILQGSNICKKHFMKYDSIKDIINLVLYGKSDPKFGVDIDNLYSCEMQIMCIQLISQQISIKETAQALIEDKSTQEPLIEIIQRAKFISSDWDKDIQSLFEDIACQQTHKSSKLLDPIVADPFLAPSEASAPPHNDLDSSQNKISDDLSYRSNEQEKNELQRIEMNILMRLNEIISKIETRTSMNYIIRQILDIQIQNQTKQVLNPKQVFNQIIIDLKIVSYKILYLKDLPQHTKQWKKKENKLQEENQLYIAHRKLLNSVLQVIKILHGDATIIEMLLSDEIESVKEVIKTFQTAELALFKIPLFANITAEFVSIVGQYLVRQAEIEIEAAEANPSKSDSETSILGRMMSELINLTMNSCQHNQKNQKLNTTIFWLFNIIYTQQNPNEVEQQQYDKLLSKFIQYFNMQQSIPNQSSDENNNTNNILLEIIYNNLQIVENEQLMISTLKVFSIILNDSRILEEMKDKGHKIQEKLKYLSQSQVALQNYQNQQVLISVLNQCIGKVTQYLIQSKSKQVININCSSLTDQQFVKSFFKQIVQSLLDRNYIVKLEDMESDEENDANENEKTLRISQQFEIKTPLTQTANLTGRQFMNLYQKQIPKDFKESDNKIINQGLQTILKMISEQNNTEILNEVIESKTIELCYKLLLKLIKSYKNQMKDKQLNNVSRGDLSLNLSEKNDIENLNLYMEQNIDFECLNRTQESELFVIEEHQYENIRIKNCNIDLLKFELDTVQLVQTISQIILTLSSICSNSSQDGSNKLQLLHKIICPTQRKNSLLKLIGLTLNFADYEVLINMMEVVSNLLIVSTSNLSGESQQMVAEIRDRAYEDGCLHMLINNYNSPVNSWCRVQRICKEKLQLISNEAPSLFGRYHGQQNKNNPQKENSRKRAEEISRNSNLSRIGELRNENVSNLSGIRVASKISKCSQIYYLPQQ